MRRRITLRVNGTRAGHPARPGEPAHATESGQTELVRDPCNDVRDADTIVASSRTQVASTACAADTDVRSGRLPLRRFGLRVHGSRLARTSSSPAIPSATTTSATVTMPGGGDDEVAS